MTQFTGQFDAYIFSKQPGYDERAFRGRSPRRCRCAPSWSIATTRAPSEFPPRSPRSLAMCFRGDCERRHGEEGRVHHDAVRGRRRRWTRHRRATLGYGRAAPVRDRAHRHRASHLLRGDSFTADGIIDAYAREHGTDIGSLYPRESICISDYVSSLTHDVRLTRTSAGTPRQVAIYGCVYDIDAETLSLIVEDKPAAAPARRSARTGSGLDAAPHRPVDDRRALTAPRREEFLDVPSSALEIRARRVRHRFSPGLPAGDRLAVGLGLACGSPRDSQYFMMIVGVYATLGVFLLMAARNPQVHRSLIWFTVWSSVVHGAIMAVQSMPAEHHWAPPGRCARALPRRGRARRVARVVRRGAREGGVDTVPRCASRVRGRGLRTPRYRLLPGWRGRRDAVYAPAAVHR